MEIQGKIVLMVFITLTMGQPKEHLDIMKEMMAGMKMEMNERLSLAEGKLAKTEAELAATKDELAATKDELAATRDELAVTKEALMSKTDELERKIAILRSPPFLHTCGSHNELLGASSGTIPYTSLLYSSTNTEGGGLDISTGVFTAPCGGSYTVSWATSAKMYHGQIFLQKNGENINQSLHYSDYGGNSVVAEQGKGAYAYYVITLGGVGGQGLLDDNDYALRGGGLSTKMITYYMTISA